VLPWHNDFLTHLSMFPFWALTGVAVYALARELGAGAAAATVGACLLLTMPAIAVPALIAGLVDVLAAFGVAAGLLFLARHWRTGKRSDLVLAGLGLGLAFGTKWYGVAAAVLVLIAWAAARLISRRPPGELVRQAAALAGLILAAGGIWMVRNWVESGNPVLPLEVTLLGHTIFGAPPDVLRAGAGFSLADYIGDTGVWGDLIWPQLRHSMAAPVAVAGLGFAVAAAALAGLGPRPRRRTVLAFALAVAALLVVAYVVTPYSAGGPAGAPLLVADDARYAGPALAALAAVAAAGVAGRPRLAAALGVLALAAMIDGARWSSGAGREAASLDPLTWGAVIVATVVVWLCWPRFERRLPGRPLAWAAAGIAAVVVVATGGYRVQRDFNDGRYLGVEPALDYLISNAPSGTRVGLAGLWDDQGIAPVLPALGPRLGNQVAYVGRSDQDILRRYTDEAAFDAALDRGDYDYLIVGLGRPDDRHIPEEGWAERAGWTEVVSSDRLALLRPPPT
jgi:hypothetical protein